MLVPQLRHGHGEIGTVEVARTDTKHRTCTGLASDRYLEERTVALLSIDAGVEEGAVERLVRAKNFECAPLRPSSDTVGCGIASVAAATPPAHAKSLHLESQCNPQVAQGQGRRCYPSRSRRQSKQLELILRVLQAETEGPPRACSRETRSTTAMSADVHRP